MLRQFQQAITASHFMKQEENYPITLDTSMCGAIISGVLCLAVKTVTSFCTFCPSSATELLN